MWVGWVVRVVFLIQVKGRLECVSVDPKMSSIIENIIKAP